MCIRDRNYCINWLQTLGIKEDEMRVRDHEKEELSHYSKATSDIEFMFPFGWGELWGIADRTDYDLTQHQNTSGEDLTYFDDVNKERYIPYVIEPSLGEMCIRDSLYTGRYQSVSTDR